METIKTNDYTITIDNGLFDNIAQLLKTHTNGTCHIIVDSKVYKLYQESLKKNLEAINYTITIVRDGEGSKSFTTYQDTVAKLIQKGIRRDDLLVALGGGVIGDLCGFIAATLYRGIPFVQIPTTLLSMVDSSIGGKTAINLPQGKNLVGAFNMPEAVFIDPEFLSTLEENQLRSGLVEVYKAALLGDKNLLEDLKVDRLDNQVIKRAIEVKRIIVEQDPYDQGTRLVLNFGHTFGHAIEKAHNFETYTHGEAVAEGIIMALQIGVDQGITPNALCHEIKAILLEKHLVTEPLLNYKDYLPYISHDKKMSRDGLRFVFLKDYEHPVIKTIDQGAL